MEHQKKDFRGATINLFANNTYFMSSSEGAYCEGGEGEVGAWKGKIFRNCE